MNSPKIILRETTFTDDKSGRVIRRIVPEFVPDVCGSGVLRFAAWEAWEDEPETIPTARHRAANNAREVLAKFAGAVACKPYEVAP